MDFRSLKYVVAACAGEQSSGSPEVTVGRVCSDSRRARAGDLFFALAGDRFDGHDFLPEVARKGAAAVVVARGKVPANLPCAVIAVDDPRRALGRLAAAYRADFDLPGVGGGGSHGTATAKRVVRGGLGEGNDWRATGLRLDEQGVRFRVGAPKAGYSGEYRINLAGRHQVVNALFALAVGAELNLPAVDLQNGLTECQPAKMRMQIWNWNGVCVLDDAYNANADSMLAALETLREMPCAGRRVAVLGDMAELGAHAQAGHEEVGRRAAELGVGELFVVGAMAGVTANAAGAAGGKAGGEVTDIEGAAGAGKPFFKTGDVMLLKASRAARLERLAEALKAPGGKKV